MLRKIISMLTFACCTGLAGCASSSYVALLENPDGTTGAIVVNSGGSDQLVSDKNHGVAMDGSGAGPVRIDAARLETDFAAARAAQPALPVRYQFYFHIGSAVVTKESAAIIANVSTDIKRRGASAITITGHTDTVGDDAFNEELGLARAHSIAVLLKKTGIQVLEMLIISHGKRSPLVPTVDGVDEPRNRRAEVNVR